MSSNAECYDCGDGNVVARDTDTEALYCAEHAAVNLAAGDSIEAIKEVWA